MWALRTGIGRGDFHSTRPLYLAVVMASSISWAAGISVVMLMKLLESWAPLQPRPGVRYRRMTSYKEMTGSLGLHATCVSHRTRTLECCVFPLGNSYLTKKSNQNADMLQMHLLGYLSILNV